MVTGQPVKAENQGRSHAIRNVLAWTCPESAEIGSTGTEGVASGKDYRLQRGRSRTAIIGKLEGIWTRTNDAVGTAITAITTSGNAR